MPEKRWASSGKFALGTSPADRAAYNAVTTLIGDATRGEYRF